MKKLSIALALLIAGATVGGDQENPVFWLHDWVHPKVAEAGRPACDPNQPKRPPCDMKSCMQMGPDGKPTGKKCSSYCSHGCCGCGSACAVDYPGEGPNPDEGQDPAIAAARAITREWLARALEAERERSSGLNSGRVD